MDHKVEVDYHHAKAYQDKNPLKDKKDKPIPLNKVVKVKIFCGKKAEKVRKSSPSGCEPQTNPDMFTGTKLFL